MTIQAVFFDMGGTIETFWHTPELRLKATPGIRQLLLDGGIDIQLDDEKLFETVSGGLARYHRQKLQSLDEFSPQKIWCEYILAEFPVDPAKIASIAEPLMLYIETHYYQREMRPEIPAALEAVRNMGLKIGLISNVSSRGQVPYNLKQYGILQFFNPIVLSSEYGRRKPDPSIFYYAARLARVPTCKCLYVGDRISRDIIGARKAGFKYALQIEHEFKHGEEDDGATPDAVLHSMDELVEFLRHKAFQKPAVGDRNKPAGVQALLFDAADILYYLPNRGKRLSGFLKELGLNNSNDASESRASLYDQAFIGQISLDQYREAQLYLYGVTEPQDIQRGKQILDEEANDIRFFEGVCETLLALKKQGLMLAVVTDTTLPLYIKLGWFERGGFGDVWDSVISSKELGMRKPCPEIYQAALDQLGVSGKHAAFVGHKKSELDGAHAVGLKTIAFNYDENAAADTYIENFSDLLKLDL
jgi:putative hydrolase of the HAD superfamily